MNAALKSVTASPGVFCSLEDERMRQIGQLTAENRERGTRNRPRGGCFCGSSQGAGSRCGRKKGTRYVSSRIGIAAGGSRRPSRATGHGPSSWRDSTNRKLGPARVCHRRCRGLMAFGLLPRYRGLGHFLQPSVPSIQYLRQYTLTVLTARDRRYGTCSGQGLRAGRLCFLGTIRLSGPDRTPV